ncbi:nucleotidyltransferase family protein [bacterium]|nr:nucleotidyltransferase family protein [bacterium]
MRSLCGTFEGLARAERAGMARVVLSEVRLQVGKLEVIVETKKTKTLEELTVTLTKRKAGLKEKYKIKKLGIFGSYARGTAVPGSDVDLLVELVETIGLDFVSLAEEIEQIVGLPVDLVSLDAIKPKMLPYIREDLVYV